MQRKVINTKLNAIREDDLHKHIFVLNDRIYRIDTMKDITDQKFIQIYGQRINVRKAAFYLLNKRWPAPNFLLPWE